MTELPRIGPHTGNRQCAECRTDYSDSWACCPWCASTRTVRSQERGASRAKRHQQPKTQMMKALTQKELT